MQTAPVKPEVCKREFVTGSRVATQLVCKSKNTDKRTEQDQDTFRRNFLEGGGNGQPVLPTIRGGG